MKAGKSPPSHRAPAASDTAAMEPGHEGREEAVAKAGELESELKPQWSPAMKAGKRSQILSP